MSRRIKSLHLGSRELRLLITGQARLDLPNDAKIIEIRDAGTYLSGMRLFVESETYLPVEPGVEPPFDLAMVTTTDGVAGRTAGYNALCDRNAELCKERDKLQADRDAWRLHAYGEGRRPCDDGRAYTATEVMESWQAKVRRLQENAEMQTDQVERLEADLGRYRTNINEVRNHRDAWRAHAYGGPKPRFHVDAEATGYGPTCTQELEDLRAGLKELTCDD